jgi:hypothetical protein
VILLRLISWPYARKHLLRVGFTMAGIVLGVAVFVGMHMNQILAAFHQTMTGLRAQHRPDFLWRGGFRRRRTGTGRTLPEVKSAQ